MREIKKLMLANDARISTNPCITATNITMVDGSIWLSSLGGHRFAEVKIIAAVSACWWLIYAEDMYMQFKDDKGKKAEFMGRLWLSLTTAESLEDYEFDPWKEMEDIT